jgi:hypothetical protein
MDDFGRTFVNGLKIFEKTELHDEDRITFGHGAMFL